MRGSVGSAVRRMSRWDIKSRVSEERPGEKLFILPLGMLWFAAEIKALRSFRSERTGVAGMKGSKRGDRMDSISSVKPGQFALWKLVKVRLCDGELDVGGFESGREIRIWEMVGVECGEGGPGSSNGDVGGGDRDVRRGWDTVGRNSCGGICVEGDGGLCDLV